MRNAVAAGLPAGELLVALLLLIPRTRRAGLVLSLVMHALLLLAVGPWGMNHSWGVILWNVFLIGQNGLLLWDFREIGPILPSALTVRVALLSVLMFPALRYVSGYDNWPSWAVYVSDTPRMLVQVRNSAAEKLPDSVRQFVEPRPLSDGWSWLRIDKWSIAETGSPIYPEERFQFAIALTVQQRYGLDGDLELIREGQSDRFTGQRDVEPVTDLSQRYGDEHYSINTAARGIRASD